MIKYIRACIFTLILFTGFSAYSHQGGIKGNLVDSISKEQIKGVTISLIENNQITSTDLLGNFYFADVHPGVYTLKLSALAYETKTKIGRAHV